MSAAATALATAGERQATDLCMPNTSAMYDLHASDVESLQQLETRVRACFAAGGLATGCAHEATRVSPVYCGDAVNHQPEFVTACATPSADRAVCDRTPALALTGLAVATDDAQRERLVSALPRRSVRNDARAAAQ